MIHKIKVCNKIGTEENTTTGANTVVLLDGKPLIGAQSFKFEVEANGIAKVTIKMLASVELDISTPLEKSEGEPTGLTFKGKQVNLYTLSSQSPALVAEKEST